MGACRCGLIWDHWNVRFTSWFHRQAVQFGHHHTLQLWENEWHWMMNDSAYLLTWFKLWINCGFPRNHRWETLGHHGPSRLVRMVRRNLRNCVEPGKLRAYRPTEKPGDLQIWDSWRIVLWWGHMVWDKVISTGDLGSCYVMVYFLKSPIWTP